ncbi:MAG: AMP-binding protein [Flavobacteriaceae bacterium]
MTAAFDWAAHAAKMRAKGWWIDRTVDSLFSEQAAMRPDKDAIVEYRADGAPGEATYRLTYRELNDLAGRAAAALRDMGVGPRDIVSVQLPNWWQFVVMVLACGRLGAVINPLMPILREYELKYMLGHCGSKVLVVPKAFRGFDHEEMAEGLKAGLPALEHIVVVGGDGANAFESILLGGERAIPPPGPSQKGPVSADEFSVLAFTSGTTGQPKGVMHCNNSVIATVRTIAGQLGHSHETVLLGCSPLGHMTGYVVLVQGLHMGGTIVLQDIWNADEAVRIMVREGVTHVGAAPVFLNDTCIAAAKVAGAKPQLKTWICSGAPIPPALIERAWNELGFPVSSLWGMTECLTGTLTAPEVGREKSATTDGCAVPGMEIRIVDDNGKELPPRAVGRLQARGLTNFMGYYKRPDVIPFDENGWLDSGDLAFAFEDGYIRIAGRTKDVIIRGGENIPVVEIENLIFAHPAVTAVALVGYPDERLGERACAYVTVKPGEAFDLPLLRAYLADAKVAKQFWPERVEVLDEMPRTASGKIQKFELRDRAKAFAA